jgi:hypothetical protein
MVMSRISLVVALAVLGAMCCGCGKQKENKSEGPPCQPTCWQHSPEQVTDSLDQADAWTEECREADSGCSSRFCVAVTMEFRNPPDERKYTVQCESAVKDEEVNAEYCDYYGRGGDVAEFFWLGFDYGALSETQIYQCDSAPEYAKTPTGWALESGVFSAYPDWTADRIQDALVHEVVEGPCEDITDLRACIRAFIPPDIHCTPNIDPDTGTHSGCESRQEPYDRLMDWQKLAKEGPPKS